MLMDDLIIRVTVLEKNINNKLRIVLLQNMDLGKDLVFVRKSFK